MNVRIALPLLAALTALVAGCSGSSDKPQTLPTLTATPTATSSVAPVPATAKLKTPQGAEAFVRFYFQQLNVAFSTSNPAIIRDLSDPICKTCDNYAKSFGSPPTEFIRGDSFVLTDVAVPPIESNVVNVEAFGTVPARALVKGDGTLIRKLPASGRFHLIVAVAREGQDWRVASIGKGS